MTNLKKVTVILIAVLIGVIFAWHLILTIIETRRLNRNLGAGSLPGAESSMESSISINPLTDIVTMTVITEPDENPFSALGTALGQALLPAAFESMLNGVLSGYPPDPYASIVPYRVRVVTKSPDLQTLERLRAAKEKAEEEIQRQKEQAEEAKLERVRAYVKDNLSIENLRAGLGSRTGDPPLQDTVEGTIVNHGKKSLKEVQVRFYFLDAEGARIGEPVDFYPVLVTEYSFGDDAMPLRPGQRKSFGYLVGAKVPDGWGKKFDAEIIDFKFLDEKE